MQHARLGPVCVEGGAGSLSLGTPLPVTLLLSLSVGEVGGRCERTTILMTGETIGLLGIVDSESCASGLLASVREYKCVA